MYQHLIELLGFRDLTTGKAWPAEEATRHQAECRKPGFDPFADGVWGGSATTLPVFKQF